MVDAAPASILIVEDDGPLLEVLRYVLEDEGYDVLTAEDGPAALKLAAVHRLDLVLLDVGMATMNGFDVARALRSDGATSAIPIAFHTGMAEEAVRSHCTSFDLYLPKADDVQLLLSSIGSFTDAAAKARAGRGAGRT